MINTIDLYTRLKLKIGKEVLITYYTSYGIKEEIKYILDDVVGLDYLVLVDNNSENKINVPFFGNNSMIGKIEETHSSDILYYNKYVNESLFVSEFIEDNKIEEIKIKLFGENRIKLEDRKNYIQKFDSRNIDFDYNDLFITDKQKKEFEEFFKLLIDDISRHCKNNNLDCSLSIVGCGSTSIVYSIGDKIIKIGKPRRSNKLPFCEHLLQPIINKDFEFDGYPIHIEVTQKVITFDKNSNFVHSERYFDIIEQISYDLQEFGIYCKDLNYQNIGILTKENKIHFDSINFEYANDEVTSIINNNNLNPKVEGEYVIIDLDCLEIYDIKKYARYLLYVGFSREYVKDFVKKYKDSVEENTNNKLL